MCPAAAAHAVPPYEERDPLPPYVGVPRNPVSCHSREGGNPDLYASP
jgi:hypothetical protein